MAASEARRCFHKREDTRKMRERERGDGQGGREGDIFNLSISRDIRSFTPRTTFIKSDADITNWRWNRHRRANGSDEESVKIRARP